MRFPAWLFVLGLALSGAAAQAADYQTVIAKSERVAATATVGGTVIPYKEVTLAAQVPGQVLFIAGSEGDAFQAGALLLTIDDDDLQAQRRAAMAEMMHAESILRNARVQYSREMWAPSVNNAYRSPGMAMPMMFDRMFSRGFGNMTGLSGSNQWIERYADLSSQASHLNQAQSRLLSSRAQVETLDAKIKDARMTAPFEGVILSKMAEAGDTVQPGQPLMKFAHTKYLRIQAEVPVRLASALREGMIVPARLDVHTSDITARVVRIYPVADAGRHTVTVKFDLPIGVRGGPGMYAEVRIPEASGGEREFVVVPSQALIWRGSLPGVFILKDGKPSLRLIRLGAPAGGGKASVIAGLKGGEQVIVNPSAGMASGGTVNN